MTLQSWADAQDDHRLAWELLCKLLCSLQLGKSPWGQTLAVVLCLPGDGL